MKRLFWWIVLLVPLAAGGLALWRRLVQPLDVRVARVVRGPAQATVFATGWIEPEERRTLRPPRAAILERIFAKEGDEVRAGEPLVRLRDSARDVKKERVRAEFDRVEADRKEGSSLRTAAEARIAEARVNENWARSEVERSKPLFEQGLLEQRAYDQLVAAQAAAGERVRTLVDEFAHTLADLEVQARQLTADLETLAATERDDLIAAPFDGIVQARFAEEGEAVDLQRDLVKFGDVRRLLVEGEVDEEDVARVALGQKVLVRVSGDVQSLIPGVVSELFPDSNRLTRSYRVRVTFPGSTFTPEGPLGLRGTTRAANGRALLPGSSCELGIVVDERADVLVFPRAALTAGGSVFVVEDGVARERTIELGLENFDRCEARAGLAEGDQVALDRLGELSDGRRVRPAEAREKDLAGATSATAASGGETPGKSGDAEKARVVELDHGPVDPLASRDAKATVLLFTRSDCPISNKYAPEVKRLAGKWQPRGVAFWLVYVDPAQTETQVREHVRDFGYPCRVALDRAHELVDLVGAKITPEVAVFTPARRIAYRGRIDDRFVDLGVARPQATTHELEDALEAVLSGREPAVAHAPPVGCVIDDLR